MVYEWKSGARFKADPQKVGEELDKIPLKTAGAVLKTAKNKPKSELHRCFPWDDAAAAHEHRMELARCLLRMVIVVEEAEDKSEEPMRYRAFEAVDLPEDDDTTGKALVYMPTRQVLSDPDLRGQIMARLERTIHEAEKTAERYASLVPALHVTRQKLYEARVSVRA